MAGSFARERDPLTLPGASFERTYQSADPQRAKTILMADAISEYKKWGSAQESDERPGFIGFSMNAVPGLLCHRRPLRSAGNQW